MGHKTTHSHLLFLLFLSLLLPATAVAQSRVALVIGNADYHEAPLRNPLNDARDMAQALRDLGFEVIEVTNATKKRMLDAVNDFGVRLQQAHVGLFYYSGHGVQYHGKNYLLPLQTTIGAPADLEQETVEAERILGRMEQSQVALSVVILDACRNNPFRNFMVFRSYADRGLAALAPPIRGSLIAYATQPDNVAADGMGRNGTYTKHLLRYLKQPGLSLPALFNEVGLAVSEETQGAQVPWMHASPLPAFCFSGCAPSPASEALPSAAISPPSMTPAASQLQPTLDPGSATLPASPPPHQRLAQQLTREQRLEMTRSILGHSKDYRVEMALRSHEEALLELSPEALFLKCLQVETDEIKRTTDPLRIAANDARRAAGCPLCLKVSRPR